MNQEQLGVFCDQNMDMLKAEVYSDIDDYESRCEETLSEIMTEVIMKDPGLFDMVDGKHVFDVTKLEQLIEDMIEYGESLFPGEEINICQCWSEVED